MKTKKQKEYVGASTASRMLHIGYRRFVKEIEDGTIDLPFSRLGHKYFFRRKDVEEYFEKSFTKIKKET